MRKGSYMNAVMEDMIKHLDFIPVRSSSGEYVANGSIRVLEKMDISTYGIIQIVDGDVFSEGQIRKLLGKSVQCMDDIRHSRVEEPECTMIFVFSFAPDRAIYNAIMDYCSVNSMAVYVAILAEGMVYGKGRTQYSPAAEYILNDRIDGDLEGYEFSGNIRDIVNGRHAPVELKEATDRPVATYVLVAVNALIWVISWLTGILAGYDYLTLLGIKDPYWITAGQYWRLLTPMFLHADITHLAANSFSLVIFGSVVERIFGTRKFLAIYFIAGILGNIASFAFTPARSLGASGAVLGIGGALVYLWRKNSDALYTRRRQYLTLVFLVFFNIIYGFSQMRIDNYAHLGGALGGFLTAGVMGITHFRETKDRRLFYALAILFTAVAGIMLGFAKFSGYGYGNGFF